MINKKRAALLIALATLLKIIFLIFFVKSINLWEDHNIALNILKKGEAFYGQDGIKKYAFQFPIYPFLVFLCYKIGSINPYIPCLLNLIFTGVTAYLLISIYEEFLIYFKLSNKTLKFSKFIIIASVAAYLIHPGINYYAIYNIHPFSIDTFFLFLPLFFMFKYFNSSTKKNLIIYSITMGLAILNRSTLIVSIIPFLILAMEKHTIYRTLSSLFTIGFISFVIILPWLIRNYNRDGVFHLTSGSSIVLWLGSLDLSEGSNYLVNGNNYRSALSKEEKKKLENLNIKEQNKFFKDKFLLALRNNPYKIIKLYFIKLKNFWFFRSLIGNEYNNSMQRMIPLYKFVYLNILLFAVISLIYKRRILILLTIPVILSIIQSVFYVETRHRLIIEPILIFLALIGIIYIAISLMHLKHNIQIKKRTIINN